MQQSQQHTPFSLNMDKSKSALSPTEAFYLLNHERYVNIPKGTLSKTTPLPANYPACSMEQPVGENYAPNVYRSPITNEVYSWHYNSNGSHYILRTTNKGCEVVYFGPCIDLDPEPRYDITQWRAYLKVDRTCKNMGGKQLIWTIGKGSIYQLDVEASIATNSFTTNFFKRCPDECATVLMDVPQPCGCPQVEYIPRTDQDKGMSNHIVDIPFKFMYRHIYYDGRTSEWSDMTAPYYQDSKGCFDTNEGFPRCMAITIPIGNALVDKIEIAYNKGDNNWYSAEVIEKYKDYTKNTQQWYEREINPKLQELNFDEENCTFDYKFCNDKQCDAIDPATVTRVTNPIPRDAQGLIPIKEALGFYNYVAGSCPIDRKEIEKLELDLDCENADECVVEYATVTVRAIIHNFVKNRNQFIYRMQDGSEDDVNDQAMFGGLNNEGSSIGSTGGGFEHGNWYDQYFNGKVRNFIAYIEGTNIYGEMKQYTANNFFKNSGKLVGVIPNMDDDDTREKWDNFVENGSFFYQEVKLKVKKGTKGFIRLQGHHEEGYNPDTSTFVSGVMDIRQYGGDFFIGDKDDWTGREIYFTTCNGDVELNQCFVIRDNAGDDGFEKSSRPFHGYITDENNKPTEGIRVLTVSELVLGNGGEAYSGYTDFNGFYHGYRQVGDDTYPFALMGEKDCDNSSLEKSFKLLKMVNIALKSRTTPQGDFKILDSDVTGVTHWKDNFKLVVKVNVKDCNGNGVGGVRVALSGSKWRVTDSDGVARFEVRNYWTRNRSLRAVLIDHKGCFGSDCIDECNPCLPELIATAQQCFAADANGDLPEIELGTMILNTASSMLNRRGLKNGGRYPFGFVVQGNGRISSVCEVRYLDIPKAQEKGMVSYCDIKFNTNNQGEMRLPEWGECIKIVRGKNMNAYRLQWVIDKIDRTSNGRLKLTIQSLNDYNTSYNFKTNTKYTYKAGDRVEFIRNGDGKVFDIQTYGLLNYLTLSPFHDVDISGKEDADADYFNQLLIEDDGRLTDLQVGAIIELQNQRDCEEAPTYYQICATIPLVQKVAVDGGINGHGFIYTTPEVVEGVFETFDTYIVPRQIGTLPPANFEHHSPSDFWGDHLDDTGKGYVVNKYENEKRYGRNISLNVEGQYNYFGDFVKTFDAPEQGDIIAMSVVDGRIVLAIGENDNFLAQIADDLVRVGADGTIRALPAESIISDTQPKLKGRYGCSYESIGSVLFGDGWATWADVNNGCYVKHDYNQAVPVCEGKVQNWTRTRFQQFINHNSKQTSGLNKFRFSTGYNRVNSAIYLTMRTLRSQGIYNEKAPLLKDNDTIVYYPNQDDWGGFVSFTPEAYSTLDINDENGCAFVAFLHGIPYIHPIKSTKFNEFFGASVDRVVGISINAAPNKIKIANAIEIKSDKLWFVYDVQTDNPKFKSRIPPKRFTQNGNKFNAAFLFNENSRSGLFGNDMQAGEKPKGYYIAVTLVRDNTQGLKVNTIDSNKQTSFDELDAILSKFTTKEQSGFEQNL